MKTIYIIILLICSYAVSAQEIAVKTGSEYWDNIQKVAMEWVKSPEVAAMERYGTYPVNTYTGIPDITIPIYTIKSGMLEYPISLSYHLGGIKVKDIATWVGLGWTLKAGGSISRTVNGRPDEHVLHGWLNNSTFSTYNNNGTLTAKTVPYSKDVFNNLATNSSGTNGANHYLQLLQYFEFMNSNQIDSQSDMYNYQINGLYGSFQYNLNREIVQVPYSDNKINREKNNTYTLIDNKGIKYVFKDTENTSIDNGSTSMFDYISNWLITEIISPDLSDTIKFKYTAPTAYIEYSDSYILKEHYSYNYQGGLMTGRSEVQQNNLFFKSHERLLSSIEFRGGKIEFKINSSNNLRKDKRSYKLDSLVVKNHSGATIKKVLFEYDYFITSRLKNTTPQNVYDLRLRLDRIKITDTNNTSPQIYSFTYDTIQKLPPYYRVGWTDNKEYWGQDIWGYYNGVKTNGHLIGVLPSNLSSYKANRQPDNVYTKAGSLTKINYPTGGYTIFETEQNKNNSNAYIGGLRISKIISAPDNSGIQNITQYEYANAVEVYNPGIEQYKFIMYCVPYVRSNLGEEPRINNRWLAYPANTYSDKPHSSIGYYSGSPIVYKSVTKKEINGSQNIGKTVYTYDNPSVFSNLLEGVGSFVNPVNKFSFTYEARMWAMGNIRKEEYFKEGATSAFKTVSYEYETFYNPYPNNSFCTGQVILDRFILYTPVVANIGDARDRYEYYWTYLSTGYQKLTKVTDVTDGITQITEYKYENMNSTTKKNYLLTEKSVYNSNGDKIISKYAYPQDYSTTLYSTMVAKNMLAYLIEETVMKGSASNILSKRKREYATFGSRIYPSSEQSATGSGTYRTDVTYNLYDTYGNLRQYTTLDNISVTLLWGYKGLYPIAEIKNATFNQVESALSSLNLNTVAAKIEPAPADWIVLNNLQSSTSTWHATIYKHKPLVGITEIINPRQFSTFYEYDTFNRLKRTYINGGTIEAYDYHYKN